MGYRGGVPPLTTFSSFSESSLNWFGLAAQGSGPLCVQYRKKEKAGAGFVTAVAPDKIRLVCTRTLTLLDAESLESFEAKEFFRNGDHFILYLSDGAPATFVERADNLNRRVADSRTIRQTRCGYRARFQRLVET